MLPGDDAAGGDAVDTDATASGNVNTNDTSIGGDSNTVAGDDADGKYTAAGGGPLNVTYREGAKKKCSYNH